MVISWDIKTLTFGLEVVQYSCLENPMDRGAWKAAVQWGR